MCCKTASAFVRGRSHEKNDTPCQDRTYEFVRNGLAAVALADGAGSCVSSHVGAHHITKAIVYYIKKRFAYLYKLVHPHKHLQKFIAKELELLSNAKGCNIKDLSSTLMFVAIKNGKFFAGHIGDGVIGALNPKDTLEVLSRPDNGEAANQTYFTTSFGNNERLRIYKGDMSDYKGFVLFSDGTQESLYHKQSESIAPAVKRMFEWLQKNDEICVSNALYANLDTIIKQKTHDDCSISLIWKGE